jgi:hypothetical protein
MAKKPTYAEGWKEFSKRIRFERAEGRCECTGECGLHEERCERKEGSPTSNPNYTVMLTVAHLDAKDGICKCKEQTGIKCIIDDHCKAMCNRCHLVYDMPHHVYNARRTRAEKAGQQWLGDMA